MADSNPTKDQEDQTLHNALFERLDSEIIKVEPDINEIRRLILQGGSPKSCNRPRMWRIMLLGSPEKLPSSDNTWKTSHYALGSLSNNEEHVLKMDVPRTRGEILFFKKQDTQISIEHLLTRWCLSHDTRYRQGLNEVLAPFIALGVYDDEMIETNQNQKEKNDATNHQEKLNNQDHQEMVDEREKYSLFDAFVCKFLAAFYIDGDANINESTNNAHGSKQQSNSSGLNSANVTSFSPLKDNIQSLNKSTNKILSSASILKKSISIGGSETNDKDISSTTPPVPSPPIASPQSGGGGSGLRAHTAADIGIPLALRLVDLIIKFHDPNIYNHFKEGMIGPELYAVPWLCTALARNAPLHVVWSLWDILIAIDDPAFLPILCIDLLRLQRNQILRCDSSDILEQITLLKLNSLTIVNELRILSLKTYEQTPRGLRRPLRSICCYINVGDDQEDYDQEDYDDYDFYAEEVEEVAAAVVAAASIPMNRAVDLMTKLDDAVAAAFTPPNDDGEVDDGEVDGGEVDDGGNRHGGGGEDDKDDDEEEDVSLYVGRYDIQNEPTPQSPTPIKKNANSFVAMITPNKQKDTSSSSSSSSSNLLTTPKKTPNKKTNKQPSAFDRLLKSPTGIGLLKKGVNPNTTANATPQVEVRTPSKPHISSDFSSSFSSQSIWSPKKVKELCDVGYFILSPNELVSSLLSKNKIPNKDIDNDDQNNIQNLPKHHPKLIKNNLSSNRPLSLNMSNINEGLLPWLILDIRPKENSIETRALATSLQLPYEIINHHHHHHRRNSLSGGATATSRVSSKLDLWLQHFDSFKGSPICILDSTYHIQSQGNLLWKKLKGVGQNQHHQNLNSNSNLNSISSLNRVNSRQCHDTTIVSNQAKELANILVNELGFPLISVFSGSFLDLIEEVSKQQGGVLEPLIIDLADGSIAGKGPISPMPSMKQDQRNNHNDNNGDDEDDNLSKRLLLTEALEEAEARGHGTVAALLRRRLDDMAPTTSTISSTTTTTPSSTTTVGTVESVQYKSKENDVALMTRTQGSKTRPVRTSQEQSALKTAERRGHQVMAQKLREMTSTPKKTNSGNNGGGGGGWIEVDDTVEERISNNSSSLSSISSTFGAVRHMVNRADEWVEKHMEGLLDDVPMNLNQGRPSSNDNEEQETTYDGNDDELDGFDVHTLDHSSNSVSNITNSLNKDIKSSDVKGGERGGKGGGDSSNHVEDEWTEVGVPINVDVADALKTIQEAINTTKS